MAIALTDGNAFALIGAGRKELKAQGRESEIAQFTADMTAGDYNELLQTLLRWFPDAELAE